MATSQTEIRSPAIELSAEAFNVFCEGISGMFGVDIQCNEQQAVPATISDIEQRFENLVAVDCVRAEGALEGTLQFVFDREGLFTLAGIVLGMPEAKILENTEHGSLEDAEGLSDAVREIGHLMAGAWQRLFNEKLDGQSRFVKISTFIGDPWHKAEEKIDVAGDKELLLVSYEITIEPYPAFECGVILSGTILAGTSVSLPEEAALTEGEAEEKTEEETKGETEVGSEEKGEEGTKKGGAEAGSEEKGEEETEGEAEAETEEKGSDVDEDATKEEPEASAEDKDTPPDTDAASDVAEEEAAAHDQDKDSTVSGVSESIQNMTQSSAVLTGELDQLSFAMSAEEIMQKEVVWGTPDDSVQQALTKMQHHDVGYIMIGQGGVLEGIVSRSDLTGAISPYLRPIFAKWRRPSDDATLQIKIKWIMSKLVRTIEPQASVASVIENIVKFGGGCLPVVDQQGQVQGLVTAFDIFKVLSTPEVSTAGGASALRTSA